MKYSTQPVTSLTSHQIDAWDRIQVESPMYHSPFFRREMAQEAARVHHNVEVCVLEENKEAVGFFPFIRDQANIARPVAAQLTDFQGVVVRPDVAWDPKQMVRECGLIAWPFRQLVADQTPCRPYHWATSESPYIDLTEGFEAFRKERKKAGTSEIQEALRKTRKIQREHAPLRFVPCCTDRQVLRQLLEWKSEQLRTRRVPNPLNAEWIRPFFENLIEGTRGTAFSGMLSALFLGDRLLAATMGVRSRHVLHGWVTSFDRELAKYSPGMLLVVQLAMTAPSLGISRIDMGNGREAFKRSLRSGAVPLAEGSVDLRPITSLVQQNWVRIREMIRASFLGQPARAIVNRIRYAFR